MKFQRLAEVFRVVVSTLILISVCVGGYSNAESSVWKIEKEGKQIYLGGTVHVLTEADFPLPKEYDEAYAQADKIYFETNIDAASSTAFAVKMGSAMKYSDGRTLRSVLEPEVYRELNKYLIGKGLPSTLFESFTAAGVSLSITLLELRALGYTNVGVDKYFHDLAKKEGKTLSYFETPEQQLAFISNIGEGIENEFVRHTLSDLDRLSEMFDEMKAQWLKGDVWGLYDSMVVELQLEFPQVYHSILVDRNYNWLPNIEAMFADDDIEFVLVGAAHMAGPDGLLALLAEREYAITQLGSTEFVVE